MKIEYIREFLVLAETESYSKAAKFLNTTQPLLTRHIQKLEKDIGVSLFIRSTKNVTLSLDGRIFLAYANKLVRTYEDYLRFEHTSYHHDTLNLGISFGKLEHGFSKIISDFTDLYDISVNIVEDSEMNIKNLLLKDKCDLAIIREMNPSDDNGNFSRINYSRETLVALLPPEHPLAGQASIKLEQLAGDPFVFISSPLMSGMAMSACREAGFTPRIRQTVSMGINAVDLVANGVGVALSIRYPVMHSNVAVLEIKPSITSYVNLLYHNSDSISKPVKQFLSYFQKLQGRG